MGHLVTMLQKKRIIVQDSFNRVDNATTIGKADTGQSWVASVGTWGISNNQLYCPVTGGGSTSASIDSNISDCKVSCDFTVIEGGANKSRLIARLTDIANYIYVESNATQYLLIKRVAGAGTTLGSASVTNVNGDNIKLVLVGSSIKMYVNGILKLTVTETFNQTATKHGIGTNNSIIARFDNFTVEAL